MTSATLTLTRPAPRLSRRWSLPALAVLALMAGIYSRIPLLLAERYGTPNPTEPVIAALVLWVWWRRFDQPGVPWLAGSYAARFATSCGIFLLATLPGLFASAPDATIDMMSVISRDAVVGTALVYVIVATGTIWAALAGMTVALGVLGATTVAQQLGVDVADGFVGLAGTSVQLVGDFEQGERSIGPYEDPNFFAQVLVILLGVTLHLAIRGSDRLVRAATAGVALLGLAALGFTYSRGGFFAFGALCWYLAWQHPRHRLRLIGALALGIVIATAIAPSDLLGRATSVADLRPSMVEIEPDPSVRGRVSESLVAVDMFQASPVVGIGYGRYDESYLDYSTYVGLDSRRENRAAHNLYLEIAAEVGLIGVLAAVVAVWRLWSPPEREHVHWYSPWAAATACRASVLAFACTALFLHDVHPRPWMIALALLAAAAAPEPDAHGLAIRPAPR